MASLIYSSMFLTSVAQFDLNSDWLKRSHSDNRNRHVMSIRLIQNLHRSRAKLKQDLIAETHQESFNTTTEVQLKPKKEKWGI